MADFMKLKKLFDPESYAEPKSPIQEDIELANQEQERLNRFLDTISMIESSGGKNFDHREIDSGIHEGHRASGRYGLMPNTIKEVINRKLRDNPENDLKPLLNKGPDELKSFVETNPDVEQRIAGYLGNKVLKQYDNDEEKAAYSWLYGHNLPKESIDKRNYKEDDYVKKYNNYSRLLAGDEDE